MGTEIVRAGGRELRVVYPSDVSVAVARQIVEAAAAIAEVVYRSVSGFLSVKAEMDGQRRARIAFLDRYEQVQFSQVIPVLAEAKAHQDGRDRLNRWNLDADLYDGARAELDRRRSW